MRPKCCKELPTVRGYAEFNVGDLVQIRADAVSDISRGTYFMMSASEQSWRDRRSVLTVSNTWPRHDPPICMVNGILTPSEWLERVDE